MTPPTPQDAKEKKLAEFREKNAAMFWDDAEHCTCIAPPEGATEKTWHEWFESFLLTAMEEVEKAAEEKGYKEGYKDRTDSKPSRGFSHPDIRNVAPEEYGECCEMHGQFKKNPPTPPNDWEEIAQSIIDRFFINGATVKKDDYDFALSLITRIAQEEYKKGVAAAVDKDSVIWEAARTKALNEAIKAIEAFDISRGILGEDVKNPIVHLEDIKKMFLAALNDLMK